jgi:hypothetical protein
VSNQSNVWNGHNKRIKHGDLHAKHSPKHDNEQTTALTHASSGSAKLAMSCGIPHDDSKSGDKKAK